MVSRICRTSLQFSPRPGIDSFLVTNPITQSSSCTDSCRTAPTFAEPRRMPATPATCCEIKNAEWQRSSDDGCSTLVPFVQGNNEVVAGYVLSRNKRAQLTVNVACEHQ